MTAIKIIACGAVYFLVVFLLVIRRQARPALPWAVCIMSQVLCAVFFYDMTDFFKALFPPETFGYLGTGLPSGILCFGNLILIFVMFGPVMDRLSQKDEEDLPEADENDFRVVPLPTDITLNPSLAASAQEDSAPDVTMEFIEKMIADGRREEALKYLKMLAYYGKDEQTRMDASLKMAELNRVEA